MRKKLYDKMTVVLMTQKMGDKLEKLANDEKTTMSSIIRSLIEKEFERKEAKSKQENKND